MQKLWEARERKTLNAGSRVDLAKAKTESNWTYATVKGTSRRGSSGRFCRLVRLLENNHLLTKTATYGTGKSPSRTLSELPVSA